MIVAGASAYSRIIDFERIAAIAKSVDALFFVDMAHIAGLVAAGVHPSPMPHADVVSTTTHKTLRGPRGGMVLCRAAYAKELDKLTFPGYARWAAGPHHRRKGRVSERSHGADVQGLPETSGGERQSHGRSGGQPGIPNRNRRHG